MFKNVFLKLQDKWTKSYFVVFFSPKTMTLIKQPSLDRQTGLGQLDKLSNNFQKSYSFKKVMALIMG